MTTKNETPRNDDMSFSMEEVALHVWEKDMQLMAFKKRSKQQEEAIRKLTSEVTRLQQTITELQNAASDKVKKEKS